MWVHKYVYFSTAWLIGHNRERYKMRNANTSWGSGTRPGSLPVRKTRKQMVGDREMPEDCRRPVKVPYQGKKVLEGFLEEGIFELGRALGVRSCRQHLQSRGSNEGFKRQARPTMESLYARLYTWPLS